MSNAFTNFLGGVVSGVFSSGADLKDYQHANRLYVRDTYARAPKTGFLYFLSFTINQNAIKDKKWLSKNISDIGLLVKKADIPRFTINTETINQYNRKAIIQTSIKYNPVSIEFHDDNSNITSKLWQSYYNYYFVDGNYEPNSRVLSRPKSFIDTKYGTIDYAYGLNNYQQEPFFSEIDIYVLHQGNFSQYTLINPMVTEWAYDSLLQDDSGKMLTNRMNLGYESVLFKSGKINKKSESGEFTVKYYDTSPSPLSIGGNGTSTLFGEGGVIAGAGSVLGTLANAQSPLDYLNAAIQAKNLGQNIKQLSKAGLKQEGYSILKGVLGEVSSTANQPGGAGASVRDAISNGNLGAVGSVGVNLFKNTSAYNTTVATAKKILGDGGG